MKNGINDRLRSARIDAGLRTAAEAAARLGVSYPTYAGHENGSRGVRVKDAERYARAFKVSAEWLLFGQDPPQDGQSEPRPAIEAIVHRIEGLLSGLTPQEQILIADFVKLQREILRPELRQSRTNAPLTEAPAQASNLD